MGVPVFVSPVEVPVSRTKKPKVFTAPIILDPEVEIEYKQINEAAFQDQKQRLETFKHRVANARALHLDPVEAEAAVQKIIEEDTAANLEWAAKVEAAKARLDAEVENYRFTSIGRKKFVELIDANPPTDEDREEWDNAEDKSLPAAVNELGFAKDLIAASCVHPPLKRDEVEAMFDDPAWNQAELTLLYMVARHAQLNV